MTCQSRWTTDPLPCSGPLRCSGRRTETPRPRNQDQEPGPDPGTRNQDPGPDPGPRTRNQDQTQEPPPRPRNQCPRTRNQCPRTRIRSQPPRTRTRSHSPRTRTRAHPPRTRASNKLCTEELGSCISQVEPRAPTMSPCCSQTDRGSAGGPGSLTPMGISEVEGAFRTDKGKRWAMTHPPLTWTRRREARHS